MPLIDVLVLAVTRQGCVENAFPCQQISFSPVIDVKEDVYSFTGRRTATLWGESMVPASRSCSRASAELLVMNGSYFARKCAVPRMLAPFTVVEIC